MNSTLILEQRLVRHMTKETQLKEIIDQSALDYHLGVGCNWPERIMRLMWLPLSFAALWFLMKYAEVPAWGAQLIGAVLAYSQNTQRKIAKLEASLELMALKREFPRQHCEDT
jgi:hypothetical protein